MQTVKTIAVIMNTDYATIKTSLPGLTEVNPGSDAIKKTHLIYPITYLLVTTMLLL